MRARLLGGLFLALQLAWFCREQAGTSRYFCWAPLHEHVFYRIDARRDGVPLSDTQIQQRYGRRGAFYDASTRELWELNAAQHVIDTIAWGESTLPRTLRAQVILHYRINERGTQTWTYTP